MSENPHAVYEPVPIGPGMKPLPETPGLEQLLPPMPKPAEPVAPRAATAKPVEPVAIGNPGKEPPGQTKPPLPGRMAWLPEALHTLIRPTRQKGIIAAGLASLGIASFAAHQFWPDTRQRSNNGNAAPAPAPLPLLGAPAARDPAAAPPPILEVSATEPEQPKLPPPRVEVEAPRTNQPPAPLPQVNLPPKPKLQLPKVDVPPSLDLPPVELPKLHLPPPQVDEQLQPAGGLQLPDAPVLPVPAPAAAAPQSDPPAPVLPSLAPPVPAPGGNPPPAGGAAPALQLPEVNPAPPTGLVLPSAELPKMETPPVALPKVDTVPSVGTGAASPPVMTPPEPPLATMPDLPNTVPPAAPLPGAEPAVKPAAALAPREDFDVDVHYPTSSDTWQSISREHLGDARYAEALRAYNGGRLLVPNQPVDIPPIRILRKQFAGLIATSPPAAAAEPPPARPAGAWRTYEVPAGGMTLKELARRAFGDENLWGPIWEMNPKLRADEPVPAGTQVRMPADARIGN